MRRIGAILRPGISVAAVLCALLPATPHAGAAEIPQAAYPPAGSPAPAAPCARPDALPALDFFCRFLTLELWQRAGQPEYLERDGKRWQAWFYGQEGESHQLLVEGREYLPGREGWFEALFDVGNFDAETYDYFWDLFRYAPWSVQFLYAGDCGGGQLLNPAALATGRFHRRHIFGLGWPGLAGDPADPGRAFDAMALPLLLAFTQLQQALEPAVRTQLADPGAARAEVNAFAAGHGRLWPDYARDGGVWLIGRDGTATALDDLDDAAARLAAHGLLVTNDAMRSWESGLLAARDIARERGTVLYLYFAQDPFLPVVPAGTYSRRLRHLLARAAAEAAGKPPALRVFSHGRSAAVVARALAELPAIAHESYAPAVSPLDTGDDVEALRHAMSNGRIDIAVPAFPMSAEQGVASPVCLELK
jgi:hypothetical protein